MDTRICSGNVGVLDVTLQPSMVNPRTFATEFGAIARH